MRLAFSGEYQANFWKSYFRGVLELFYPLKRPKTRNRWPSKENGPKIIFLLLQKWVSYIQDQIILRGKVVLISFWHFGTPYCGWSYRQVCRESKPGRPSQDNPGAVVWCLIPLLHVYLAGLHANTAKLPGGEESRRWGYSRPWSWWHPGSHWSMLFFSISPSVITRQTSTRRRWNCQNMFFQLGWCGGGSDLKQQRKRRICWISLKWQGPRSYLGGRHVVR